MNFGSNFLFNEAYEQALDQNEISENRWKEYRNDVKETAETINTFLKSYKMDIMVPIGKKAFVRGTLCHTNDILMSHGASYFSSVSNHQANDILKHREEVSTKKLKDLGIERELYRGKLDATRNDAFSEHEIIEEYDEAAEKEWREKHRENIKRHKQQEAAERTSKAVDADIDDLLDKYELIEEVAEELENLEDDSEYDYDTLVKMISGEVQMPEPKKRTAHSQVSFDVHSEDLTVKSKIELKVPTEESQQKVEKKVNILVIEQAENPLNEKTDDKENIKSKRERTKKVRFSTSLEDVKIIESKEEQQQQHQETVYPAIQIKFHHSSEKFNPDLFNSDDGDIKFRHPGEIGSAVNATTKSILKETNYKYEEKPQRQIKSYDDELYDSLSKFPLICGDVVERSVTEDTAKSPIEVSSGKKISKFKELRNKVK